MQKEWIEWLIPYIRAFHCPNGHLRFVRYESDAEKGSRIHYYWKQQTDKQDQAMLKPPLFITLNPEVFPNEKSILATLTSHWQSYEKQFHHYPEIIVLNQRELFFLDDDYPHVLQRCQDPYAGFVQKAAGTKQTDTFFSFETGKQVKHKIIVITGGAQGIGACLARQLTQWGAFVFIADLNYSGACLLAKQINQDKGEICTLPLKVDVSEEESVGNMIRTILYTVGGLDVLISNAGILKAGPITKLSYQDFKRVNQVNYFGYFLLTKYVAPVMARQYQACREVMSDIIQINSKSGLEGSNRNSAYAGSKFAGIGLTQSFAKELVGDHIKVNAICPGNFLDGPLWSDPEKGLIKQYLESGKVPGAKDTGDVRRYYESKVPMGRGCQCADIVQAVLYVIQQSYITGQAIPVTGGQVMLK